MALVCSAVQAKATPFTAARAARRVTVMAAPKPAAIK